MLATLPVNDYRQNLIETRDALLEAGVTPQEVEAVFRHPDRQQFAQLAGALRGMREIERELREQDRVFDSHKETSNSYIRNSVTKLLTSS
jgi:hypothetical protein